MTVMHRLSRRMILAAALVASAGCDLFTESGRPRVEISIPTAVFSPGAMVPVTLENRSGRTWYVHVGCNLGLQRLVDGAWVLPGGSACLAAVVEPGGESSDATYEPTMIEAGQSVVLNWFIPADASAGTYRVSVTLAARADLSGEYHHVSSPTFTVLETF